MSDLSVILAQAEQDRQQARAEAVSAVPSVSAGEANGFVQLDANGKIPINLLPSVAQPGARSYEHTQSVPSTTWTVPHGLGGFPHVLVIKPGGKQGFAPEVFYADPNNLLIKLGFASAGVAELIL